MSPVTLYHNPNCSTSRNALALLRERGIAATRQLAKRQLTWLRGELDGRRFDPERDGGQLREAVSSFLGR